MTKHAAPTSDAARRIAIVVVTYNSERFIDACLSSLRRLEHGPHEVKIFVVDNASSDRSVEIVKQKYDSVMLIENAENAGYAGGNNVALKQALAEGYDYVYQLNPDTSVAADFLLEAVGVAEADERVGSVQSLLLLARERERINSAGNAIHFLGLGYCLEYRTPVSEWVHNRVPEIMYASGAAVLYRTAALQEVGLLDEELFLYHEDLDLGWRLRLAGYSNVLAPRSRVYHDYEFSRSLSKYYYMERNRHIVLLKNLRALSLLVLFPFLVASEVAFFAVSLGSGWWREKLRVYTYFMHARVWRHIACERAKVARLRRVSDREIAKHFSSVISFQGVTGPFTKYVANPLMTATWHVLRLLYI